MAGEKPKPADAGGGQAGDAGAFPAINDTILSVSAQGIPPELKARPQWVAWRIEKRPGQDKPTKVPYNARTGYKGKSDTPSTWATFETALSTYQNGRGYNGVGYVLSAEDGYTGLDLDHCLDSDGTPEQWAATIVSELDSYTERSPGGEGLRIFVKGDLPDKGRKKGNIEVYSELRFLTMTGQSFPGTPSTIENRQAELTALHARIFGKPEPQPEPRQPAAPVNLSDAALIRKAEASANGGKFSRLWRGDWTGYESQSEGDLALAGILVFWTRGDEARIDRLFRQSGLYRPKWDEKHYADGRTYGQATIEKALSGKTEFYTPGGKQEPVAREPAADVAPAGAAPNGEEATAPPPTPADWPIYTLADAYAPRDPLTYIVADLFSLPSLSIVYGPPGCLKSMLLADAALCVAAGLPWLAPLPDGDKGTARMTVQVPVFWLDFDNGKRRTEERLEALGRARELEADSTPFYYVSMPTPWLDGNDLLSVSGLTALANSQNVGLVVIDNLGTVSGDAEENSGDMVRVLANFRLLAEETGAAVVLIHHQRKATGYKGRAGETLRGHSSIEAALDLALLVQREEHSDEVTIKSTKTRGVDVLPFGAVFAFDHKDGTTELEGARFYGVAVTDESSDAAVQRVILELVEDEPGVQKQGLIGAVKERLPEVGVNRIRNAIDRLAHDGKLNVAPGGKTGRAQCYTLS